jgi:predicted Zn-dependent protease
MIQPSYHTFGTVLAARPALGGLISQPIRSVAGLLLLMALLTGCRDSIDIRLDEAFELRESGQLELSILAIQEVLKDDPNHDQANFVLGSTLVQSDRQERAIPYLKKAAGTTLYAIPAGLLLASTQYRLKAYDETIQASQDVLEIDATNLTAIYTLGLSYLATRRFEEALSEAIRILDIRPDAQNATHIQGTALVELGRPDEAEAVWLALRERTAKADNADGDARACTAVARFYRSQNKREQAEEIYSECLGQYPTHAYLQKSASDFYVRQSLPERAIAIHRHAVDSSPENLQVWSRLAAILYLHADPKQSHETYLEIVERFDSPGAWRLLADFYQKTRQTTPARKALEEALIRAEQPPESFLYSLAELLIEEGNFDRAQKLGERLKNPSYRHLLAGAISLAQDDPQQALTHLDAGLQLWPNNPNARYLAGRAALEIHDHARAITAFGAAIRVGDGTTDAALRLAEIHFLDGNFMPARGFAKHQIARRPYLDDRPYHIAIRSALRLDRLEEANQTLNLLRIIKPDSLAVIAETSAIRRFTGGAKASSDFVIENGVDLTNPANEIILRAHVGDLNALDRTDEALKLIDAAIARGESSEVQDENGAALHDLRARVMSHLGHSEAALMAIQRALVIDSAHPPALEMRAFLAIGSGDLETALGSLDAASVAEPFESSYRYRAAVVAMQMGDNEGATLRLEQTLARRPNHGMAANDLAWSLASGRRDLDRALQLAQLAVRRMRSPTTLTTLGWVHHRRGDHHKAIETYRIALEADATLPALRYRLGVALAELGEVNEAQQILDALARGPEFPEREAARALLARLQGS